MGQLEDLQPGASIRGILPDSLITVVNVQWFGSEALELTYKDPFGRVSNELLYRNDEPRLDRRVARTIYLGSAPNPSAANRGLEDRQVKLGCVMPGESPAIFGDALRRLAARATYLYQDGPRYWYSTQPTVTKLAEDRAEQLKRDPDKVVMELDRRLRKDLEHKGDFSRVHPLPGSSADIPDDFDARLVVLGVDHPYSKESGNPALTAAKAILENRGNSPRLFRNALSFLAVDKTRLQDLDEAVRKFLAWESILAEKDTLDLSPHQVKQAENQRTGADGAVIARLPESYQWLLVPAQSDPQAPVELQAIRLSGSDALAVRAGRKMKNDELLISSYASSLLRMEMDRVPLWRGDHVAIRQLIDDFGRYLYLPRLKNPGVLLDAIRDGVGLLTWTLDSFAYADSYDEETKRYRGLRGGQMIMIDEDSSGLLVRPEIARAQMEAEAIPKPVPDHGDGPTITGVEGTEPPVIPPPSPTEPPKPKRYHGTVELDPERVGRDAGRIADEVITHLVGQLGASVRVTLEIEAEIPNGTPDTVVRIVTENGRTLKFKSGGFEVE